MTQDLFLVLQMYINYEYAHTNEIIPVETFHETSLQPQRQGECVQIKESSENLPECQHFINQRGSEDIGNLAVSLRTKLHDIETDHVFVTEHLFQEL